MNQISKNLPNPNRYNNKYLESILNSVSIVKNKWNIIKERCVNHIQQETVDYVDTLFRSLERINRLCNNYSKIRDDINVDIIITNIESLITDSYEYAKVNNKTTVEYNFYHNRFLQNYSNLSNFYNNGTDWSNGDELIAILKDIKYELQIYYNWDIEDLNNEEFNNLFSSIMENIDYVINNIPLLAKDYNPILNQIDKLNKDIEKNSNLFELLNPYYYIKSSTIGNSGSEYKIGDIVQLDYDKEVLLYQVRKIGTNGEVISVAPFMNYALHEQLAGSYKTITRVGNGKKLMINISSAKITSSLFTLLWDESSDTYENDKYNESDLVRFDLNNTYDLNTSYEVFIGGVQTSDFIIRHANNKDRIYIKANKIMNIQNNSIYIPGKDYFIYKINDFTIIDPGTGYSIGQDIFIDGSESYTKAIVSELDNTPFKGIKSLDTDNTAIIVNKNNPAIIAGSVIKDSLNNIDDEFNNGYYDKLTSTGITKYAINGPDKEEYVYTVKRYDELDTGDRNKSFKYPIVEWNGSIGDPTYNWMIGSSYDKDHEYNRIENVIEPIDGIVQYEDRIPNNQSFLNEFKFIKRERICNNGSNINGYEFDSLPYDTDEWRSGDINDYVVINNDLNYDGHRTAYRIKTFSGSNRYIYDDPIIDDNKWNKFHVDFYNTNSYIHQIKLSDISVYNYTLKKWEDLSDTNTWTLETFDYGFDLLYNNDELYMKI